MLSGAQGRDRYADETLLSIGRFQIHFTPLRKCSVRDDIARKPKRGPNFLNQRATDVTKLASRDFLPGAIKQKDSTFQVRGNQSAAHGMDDVFVESLQILQLPRA